MCFRQFVVLFILLFLMTWISQVSESIFGDNKTHIYAFWAVSNSVSLIFPFFIFLLIYKRMHTFYFYLSFFGKKSYFYLIRFIDSIFFSFTFFLFFFPSVGCSQTMGFVTILSARDSYKLTKTLR